VRGTAVRRADVNDAAMDTAIAGDVLAPCFVAGGELGEAASQRVMLGQSREFRIQLGDAFEYLIVDLWLLGPFGALLGHPAAGFQQGADLRT
jgi:hypothetical protein